MKFSTSIVIAKPIDELIRLYDSHENWLKWMKRLESIEHLEGIPGQEGAKSRLLFLYGRRKLEMIETVTERNFPDRFAATYQVKGYLNIVVNRFEKLDEQHTRYINEQEFRFSGFMRLLAPIFKRMMIKAGIRQLNDFKDFAESIA